MVLRPRSAGRPACLLHKGTLHAAVIRADRLRRLTSRGPGIHTSAPFRHLRISSARSRKDLTVRRGITPPRPRRRAACGYSTEPSLEGDRFPGGIYEDNPAQGEARSVNRARLRAARHAEPKSEYAPGSIGIPGRCIRSAKTTEEELLIRYTKCSRSKEFRVVRRA